MRKKVREECISTMKSANTLTERFATIHKRYRFITLIYNLKKKEKKYQHFVLISVLTI